MGDLGDFRTFSIKKPAFKAGFFKNIFYNLVLETNSKVGGTPAAVHLYL